MWLPLYWLYLWQIKEYRWDRLLSHLRQLPIGTLVKELGWGRYRRPRFTIKLILIVALVVVLSLVSIFIIGNKLWGVVIVWFASPIYISIAVSLVSFIELPIKRYVIARARSKAVILYADSLVIGVTGSYGKTTTKEFIGQLLQQQYQTSVTPQHVNQTIPLANFINSSTVVPEVLVVEYASYGRGNIQFDTSRILAPSWAVLTGIAPQHLELFGSIEAIVDAKFELINSLPSDGMVFYNADDELLSERIKERVVHETVAFSSRDIGTMIDGVSWADTLKGRLVEHIFGSNVAAAIAVANKIGVHKERIVEGLEMLSWLPRTLEIVSGTDMTIIDDSYSTNSHGFSILMDVVKGEYAPLKILVTSGVIELGDEWFDINHRLALKATNVFDHVFITSTALSPAWNEAGTNVYALNEEGTIDRLHDLCQPGTLLVMEGRIPERIRNAILAL